MEGNAVLHQLMAVRMENVMRGITEIDTLYQKTKQRFREYSYKLDALQLPRETRLLIDRYASEHIANVSRYRELAYQLGFTDCKELLLKKQDMAIVTVLAKSRRNIANISAVRTKNIR